MRKGGAAPHLHAGAAGDRQHYVAEGLGIGDTANAHRRAGLGRLTRRRRRGASPIGAHRVDPAHKINASTAAWLHRTRRKERNSGGARSVNPWRAQRPSGALWWRHLIVALYKHARLTRFDAHERHPVGAQCAEAAQECCAQARSKRLVGGDDQWSAWRVGDRAEPSGESANEKLRAGPRAVRRKRNEARRAPAGE